MVENPQSLVLLGCNPLTEILDSEICKPCDNDTDFLFTNVCNRLNHRRFFTYTVTQDPSKVDDAKNFHGILTLENFDINTSVFPTLQTWLTSNLQLDPNPGGSIVFETIEVPRIPTAGNTISMPFKLQLGSDLSSD